MNNSIGVSNLFYKKELEFFIKSFEALKIRTAVITEKNIPEDIDMGIRRLLNLQEDYDRFLSENLSLFLFFFNTKYLSQNRREKAR